MPPFKVISSEEFNNSNIKVEIGETYSFYAKGIWVDLIVPCGPNGWLKKILNCEPVLKGVPIFKLCACIDKDLSTAFPIGDKLENKKMEHNGTLYFFANDVEGFYKNNLGSIEVEIFKNV